MPCIPNSHVISHPVTICSTSKCCDETVGFSNQPYCCGADNANDPQLFGESGFAQISLGTITISSTLSAELLSVDVLNGKYYFSLNGSYSNDLTNGVIFRIQAEGGTASSIFSTFSQDLVSQSAAGPFPTTTSAGIATGPVSDNTFFTITGVLDLPISTSVVFSVIGNNVTPDSVNFVGPTILFTPIRK